MNQRLVVRKTETLKAPIAEVWDALTNPALTPNYMYGCAIISSWKPGEEVTWELDGKVLVTGKVVKIEPGKHLHFTTFDPNIGLEDIPANYIDVTYTLSQQGPNTILEISQGDFAGAENAVKRYEESANGWDYAIQGLKALLER